MVFSKWHFLASASFILMGWGTLASLSSTSLQSLVSRQDSSSTASYASVPRVGANEKKEIRVGIQAGHWKNSELPDELSALWFNGGTSVNGVDEWEVNLEVAQLIAEILRKEGVVVDVLPGTIPPSYKADAFISIHADGNEDSTVSGYKVGASELSLSDGSQPLAAAIEQAYGEATKMRLDPNVTPNMTQYYAFNSNRFIHSIHPKTPGVLVEIGFLTNVHDRRMLVYTPEKAAQPVAEGILTYLRNRPQ